MQLQIVSDYVCPYCFWLEELLGRLKERPEVVHVPYQLTEPPEPRPDVWNDPESRRKIEQIDLLLQGALRAESLVCLKMNAPTARLDAILALLPALNSPTVAALRDPAWVSLETVVDTHVVRDLIPQLHELGAEGILEYSLNKVI